MSDKLPRCLSGLETERRWNFSGIVFALEKRHSGRNSAGLSGKDLWPPADSGDFAIVSRLSACRPFLFWWTLFCQPQGWGKRDPFCKPPLLIGRWVGRISFCLSRMQPHPHHQWIGWKQAVDVARRLQPQRAALDLRASLFTFPVARACRKSC